MFSVPLYWPKKRSWWNAGMRVWLFWANNGQKIDQKNRAMVVKSFFS